MTEHPMAENAALEIMIVLKEISSSWIREERLYQRIVGHEGWETEDVANGLAHAENHGWIKRVHARVSAVQLGLDALAQSEI